MKFALRILTALLLITATLHGGRAYADCTNPAGVEGEIVFNETSGVPQYCDDTNWIAMTGGNPVTGGPNYIPNAVNTENVTRLSTSSPSDLIDTKQFTVSFWFQVNQSFSRDFIRISTPTSAGLRIYFNTGQNNIWFTADDGTGEALRLRTIADSVQLGQWYHYMASIDLSDTNKRHVYINGQEISDGLQTHTDTAIPLSTADEIFVANDIDLYLADMWFESDLYVDLSIPANREKFITADGFPVDLGGNGTNPEDLVPDIYLSGDTANWEVNKGTAGGFTESGGLLINETTYPTQYRTKIVPSGLVGHWRLDETSGTTAFDTSGNNYDGTMQNGLENTSNSVDGVIKRGREFTSITQRVEVTHGGGLDNLDEITISAWLYRNSNGGGAQGRIVEIPGNLRFTLWNDSIRFLAERWNANDGDWRAGAALPKGQWSHYVITYDYSSTANDPVVYVNGSPYVLPQSTSPTGSLTTVSSNVYLGNDDGTTGLGLRDNTLDDVRIYNRILTPDEIVEIYAARDGIRYNESHRRKEFFDGNQFVSMTPEFPEPGNAPIVAFPDLACPNTGDVCSDGSVYVGISPDGDAPMYTTPADAPGGQIYAFNNANATGKTVTGATDIDTGEANTNAIIATDADSVTTGFQPHQAAQYCADLNVHGHDDWYLPARSEASLFNGVTDVIGGFVPGATCPTGCYWVAREVGGANGATAMQRAGTNSMFITGAQNKENLHNLRCVRKGDLEFTGTSGLIGHWKLDETSGTTAVDSSGNANDGTMSGGLDASNNSIRGPLGKALYFPDTNNEIIEDSSGFPSLNGDSTISFWMNPSSNIPSFNRDILGTSVGTNNVYGLRIFDNGELMLRIVDSSNSVNSEIRDGNASTARFNEWRHYTVSRLASSGSIKWYENGVNYATDAGPTNINVDSAFFLGEGAIGNNRFMGGLDDVRVYNRVLSDTEISQLYAMGTPIGSSTALPQGCPNIGDVCDDGTIYAGLSPDGSVEMFTTSADGPDGLRWNDGNNSGYVNTSVADTGCSGPPCGTPPAITGEANTLILVVEDSNSGTVGFQPHQAAQYCYNLVSNGSNDWYLPAQDEAYLLFQAKNTGALDGTIEERSGFQGRYHTSTEAGLDRYRPMDMNGAAFADSKFGGSTNIRCVRKGPAPRCANPYGLEGQMIYNSTHDIVQYCDGARWLGIGKDG